MCLRGTLHNSARLIHHKAKNLVPTHPPTFLSRLLFSYFSPFSIRSEFAVGILSALKILLVSVWPMFPQRLRCDVHQVCVESTGTLHKAPGTKSPYYSPDTCRLEVCEEKTRLFYEITNHRVPALSESQQKEYCSYFPLPLTIFDQHLPSIFRRGIVEGYIFHSIKQTG